jgi:hypothetical protein
MARKKQYPDQTIARLPPGTLETIQLVLEPGETQGDLVRAAVTKEIKRRIARRQREGRPLNPVDEPSC